MIVKQIITELRSLPDDQRRGAWSSVTNRVNAIFQSHTGPRGLPRWQGEDSGELAGDDEGSADSDNLNQKWPAGGCRPPLPADSESDRDVARRSPDVE